MEPKALQDGTGNTGAGGQRWRAEEVARLVLGLIACMVLLGAGIEAGFRGMTARDESAARFWKLFAGLAGFQVPGLIMIHVFLRRHGVGWRDGMGFRLGRRAVLWGVALAAASVLVTYPLEAGIMELIQRMGGDPKPQASVEFLRLARPWQQAVLEIGRAHV